MSGSVWIIHVPRRFALPDVVHAHKKQPHACFDVLGVTHESGRVDVFRDEFRVITCDCMNPGVWNESGGLFTNPFDLRSHHFEFGLQILILQRRHIGAPHSRLSR